MKLNNISNTSVSIGLEIFATVTSRSAELEIYYKPFRRLSLVLFHNNCLRSVKQYEQNYYCGTCYFLNTGTYPTRKGVILSTPTNASLGGKTFVGHSAIIYSASKVVESLGDGVTTGNNNWNSTKTKCYGVTVYGTTAAEDAAAADYCYNKIGCPYNYNF